jgi:hypothetical protein
LSASGIRLRSRIVQPWLNINSRFKLKINDILALFQNRSLVLWDNAALIRWQSLREDSITCNADAILQRHGDGSVALQSSTDFEQFIYWWSHQVIILHSSHAMSHLLHMCSTVYIVKKAGETWRGKTQLSPKDHRAIFPKSPESRDLSGTNCFLSQ